MEGSRGVVNDDALKAVTFSSQTEESMLLTLLSDIGGTCILTLLVYFMAISGSWSTVPFVNVLMAGWIVIALLFLHMVGER